MNAPIRSEDTKPAIPASAGRFVHLKVHSAYSLLEGALPISKIAKLADAHMMPAIGLTDTGNMFGALEFSDKLAGAGVQPIAGVTLRVDFREGGSQGRGAIAAIANAATKPAGPLALYALTEVGYANLAKLNSAAFLKTPDTEEPHVKIEWLEARPEGIIALTGGPDGPIDTAIREGRLEIGRASCRERV